MLFTEVRNEIKIISERDPAATNWIEILFCYAGLQAIILHKIGEHPLLEDIQNMI